MEWAPGDSLAVTIDDIQPRDGQCATYTGPPRQLAEWLGDDVRVAGPQVGGFAQVRVEVVQLTGRLAVLGRAAAR